MPPYPLPAQYQTNFKVGRKIGIIVTGVATLVIGIGKIPRIQLLVAIVEQQGIGKLATAKVIGIQGRVNEISAYIIQIIGGKYAVHYFKPCIEHGR